MLSEDKMVKAYKAARLAVESTYNGVCDVINYCEATDPLTHITSKKETVAYSQLPCRISFRNNSLNYAQLSDTAAKDTQKIKLFTSPDADIKAGSKIIVTQNGRTAAYRSSGEPMHYATHQEFFLELSDRWC